jgi:uncharacterized protein (UPF0335 family)
MLPESKFKREPDSKALLNTDGDELTKYRLQRSRVLKIDRLEEDINTLKADVKLLKDILTRGMR